MTSPTTTENTSPRTAGLSRAAAEQLASHSGEPRWLQSLRLAAYELYQATPFQEQATGNWRYTRSAGLDLDDPQFTALTAQPAPPRQSFSDLQTENQAALLTLRDGAVLAAWTGPALAQSGLRVLSLADALRDDALAERVREHLGHVVPPSSDTLTALHYAFLNSGIVVYVPRNLAVQPLIQLRQETTQPNLAAFGHTLVIAEDGAEAAILETVAGPAPLASGVVEIAAGRNAQVRYAQVQQWSDQTWAFSYQRARLAADAHARLLNAALGARQARNTVQVYLDGNGSQADLLGLVFGTGRRHVDFQTLQEHVGNATRSDLVIHNALEDRSSSNFTGLIRITPTAHATESSQEQKNYLLSERARADSDPRLEILNNDVIRCTHGAAVGPIDPELLFYLQSRGMNMEQATGMALEGFFQSVVGRLGHAALQANVWGTVRHDLGLSQVESDSAIDNA